MVVPLIEVAPRLAQAKPEDDPAFASVVVTDVLFVTPLAIVAEAASVLGITI